MDRGGHHLGLGQCHPGSQLNEPHSEHLGHPGWVTWAVGESHVPHAGGSRDHQTGSGSACAILDYTGAILSRCGAILPWGLMSLIGSIWGIRGGSRGHRERVTCPPGQSHITPKREVVRPAPSWVTAGAILARGGTILPRGLMSLTGRIWDVLGMSPGHRERAGSCDCRSGSGSACAINARVSAVLSRVF